MAIFYTKCHLDSRVIRKDYVPLFQSVTESIRGTRIIFYNSAEPPDAPDCVCVRFETRTRTNWHYECARALIQGALDIPV